MEKKTKNTLKGAACLAALLGGAAIVVVPKVVTARNVARQEAFDTRMTQEAEERARIDTISKQVGIVYDNAAKGAPGSEYDSQRVIYAAHKTIHSLD